MSIWLRYLAVVTLVGNGFTVLWNVIALGRTIQIGALGGIEVGLIAFNLVFSLAAIALAALIAAPERRDIGRSIKILAIPSIVSGGIGVLSAAMGLYARSDQSEEGASIDDLAAAIDVLTMAENIRNVFFAACTLALAIWVICQRRRKSDVLVATTAK